MLNNVVRLPVADAGPLPCPAQHYRFAGDAHAALADEAFMDKAAAFQEIRDCLVAADRREIRPAEAELRIRHLVRAYLATGRRTETGITAS